MTCYIVGGCEESLYPFKYEKDDLIIAADKGYEFLKTNNYKIDLVVGDFDSLGYNPNFDHQVTLNVMKDITDLHQCIEEGIKKGYSTFKIYGCLGGRLEHTLATLQDVYHYSLNKYQFTLFGPHGQKIVVVHNDSVTFENRESGFISVFSLSPISNGVTIKGLKYEVENTTITSDFPLGVSNEFINKKATITVNDGCVAIIY